jgi:hypothetical protein
LLNCQRPPTQHGGNFRSACASFKGEDLHGRCSLFLLLDDRIVAIGTGSNLGGMGDSQNTAATSKTPEFFGKDFAQSGANAAVDLVKHHDRKIQNFCKDNTER